MIASKVKDCHAKPFKNKCEEKTGKIMIGIRVDGNSEIATGHMMRCLSLASGLKKIGLECIFITADETGKLFLSPYGYDVICLNSMWDNLNKETELMIKIIHMYKIEKLIIDTYYVTLYYLEALTAHTRVIYIDDMNFFKYPVSMVINYNIYCDLFSYKKMYQDTDTKLLLGCKFAPLRDEFIGIKPLFRNEVKKVLITTGGTDQYNIAGKLINRILTNNFFRSIEFHVVVGSLNRNYKYLKELSKDNPIIILHKDVKDMAKLITSCDIAITAGGSTMYELCACGIPSITFAFSDNQLYGVKVFEKDGIMAYAGDIRDDENNCLEKLISLLKKYVGGVEIRKEKSRKMREKVDGNGVKRVVDAIISLK